MRKKNKADKKHPPIATRIRRSEKKFIEQYCEQNNILIAQWLRKVIEKEVRRLKKELKLQRQTVDFTQLKYNIRKKLFEEIFDDL